MLIDLVGSKNFKIDEDGNSVRALLDIFGKAAKDMGEGNRMYEFSTPREKEEARRQGRQWGIIDDHLKFKDYGIPTALLIDFSQRQPGFATTGDRFVQWWHTADDNRDNMDPEALAFFGNLLMKAMPELDAFVTKKKGPVSGRHIMRWSSFLVLTVGGLGACIGAALVTKGQEHNQQDTEQEQGKHAVRIQPSIDKSKTVSLVPQKVPAYFGDRPSVTSARWSQWARATSASPAGPSS